MHAMQYAITLPADYDMGIIRTRVATKRHLLDDFDGLGLKAYLVRERGHGGSPVNEYAPFYLWRTAEGMNAFLWSPGFQGLVDDFAVRPAVHHWAGTAFHDGADAGAVPLTSVRQKVTVPHGVRPAAYIEEAVELSRQLADADGAVATAVAVDPSRWELVHFSLWSRPSPEAPGDLYQVLHLSCPERDGLTRGRHWEDRPQFA